MSLRLNMVSNPVQWVLMRKGSRLFALLGKATGLGLAPFERNDVGRAWALTGECGCLRLERLVGDEELTGDKLVMPTPFCYDYGIVGPTASPDTVRSVFGLLSAELEQLVTTLRRGSFPVLGFSRNEQKCCLTSCLIPGYWPHVVLSNMAAYGNVVSVEALVRILVSSLPQGQITARYPSLQTMLKPILRLSVTQRRGVPYSREMAEMTPAPALASLK